ncbi:rhodanese-like domain-containing protein [Clostridium paraputrificum]|uniref:rhodanese-like domain-containing protein n=1 Tax=Clostridium TaxID=1485 RepID=UPI003D343726
MFSIFGENSVKSVNVNDLDNVLGKINLIDIREPYEVKSGAIKGSKNIPMDKILSDPDQYLNKEKEYYIMCQSGMRSSRTTKALNKLGFKVINVSGGMGSYVGTKRK